MAVGAGTLLTIAAISSLAQAGASGASGYFQGKAAEDAAASSEKLARDQMGQNQRQFRDTLRQRKKEHKGSKIASGLSTLSGLAGLRQNIGGTKASQKILV